MGLCGYFIIIHAYKIYNGSHDPQIRTRMLYTILLGPIAVFLGGYMLWDASR